MVRENMKIAQSRHHSYAGTRRRELSFDMGDHVYLKVSPMRGVKRFRVKGKLAPPIYQTVSDSGKAWRSGIPV
jgi:allantoicase